jgi:hypothetical protein
MYWFDLDTMVAALPLQLSLEGRWLLYVCCQMTHNT